MRKDKETAQHLRLMGKSYQEIRDILKIPKSTLSGWFSREDWSAEIRKRLTLRSLEHSTQRLRNLSAIRGLHLARVYEDAKREALEELEVLKYHPLFVAGVMLYWGEGGKLNPRQVKLTNSDPAMVRLYVQFLLQICNVPLHKIRGQILLYPDLDEKTCTEYWSSQGGLSKENFTKATTIQGKHATRRLEYGVCMITVSSTYLKVKMLEWTRELPQQLMNRKYYENI